MFTLACQDIKLLLFSSSPKHEYLISLPVLITFRVKQNGKLKITGYAHLASQGKSEKKVQPWLESLPAVAKATAEKAQLIPPGKSSRNSKLWQGECGCFLIGWLPELDHLLSYGTLLLCDMRSLKGLHLGRTYPVSCHQFCTTHTVSLAPSRQLFKCQVAEFTFLTMKLTSKYYRQNRYIWYKI